MILKVYYGCGDVQTYHSFEEAEKGILETITGCDFATYVETVVEVDADDRVLRELGCHWGVKLVNI